MRYVHAHAAEWRINSAAVGIDGFSAGAHLSLDMAARLEQVPGPVRDAVDGYSARPAFIPGVYSPTILGQGAVVDSTYPPTSLFRRRTTRR